MSKESVKKIGIAAIIGFVAGAIVAVLVAPKSGKETRAIVSKKVKDIKTKAQNLKDDIASKIQKTKMHA